MKKIILYLSFLMLWASLMVAELAAAGDKSLDASSDAKSSDLETVFNGDIGLGWYGIRQTGNTVAGEYEYPKSSGAGALNIEWDPLPHRFVFESYFLNPKDYFGEVDYSYKDVFVLNGYARDLFHNLNHYRLGPDDPTTPSPSFTDLNPDDQYGIQNQLRRGFIRLKTPDFPFHLYADVRTIDREGTIQQRFLESGGSLSLVSQSRDIDWNTSEYRVGMNAHLGPVEFDYSHSEKKLDVVANQVLYDANGVSHNLTPDLTSSWDTIKLHTSYSGKIVLSGTYTTGDKKNEDSGAKAEFRNTAGDLMFMPVTSLIYTVRYRHYNLDVTNPNSVSSLGTMFAGTSSTLPVRDSISSSRDLVSNVLRWRATERLTFKAEYILDKTDRDVATPGSAALPTDPVWDLPTSTTKNTARAGFSYRLMNRLTLRADYTETRVDNPAYDTDPDKASNATGALTWTPAYWLVTMVSYGHSREERDDMVSPQAGGSRSATHDQGLASVTVLVGTRTSITASYAYYKNRIDQSIAIADTSGLFDLAPDSAYADTSHVGSLAVTVAPMENLNLTGSATRSWSRGNFRFDGSGVLAGTEGVAELSDMKVIDTVYAAGIEMGLTSNLNSEIRYQYRTYEDKIDTTQDGTARMVLATLSMKW